MVLEGLEQRFNEQVSALREVYEVLVLVPEEVESSYKDYSENFGKSIFLNLILIFMKHIGMDMLQERDRFH